MGGSREGDVRGDQISRQWRLLQTLSERADGQTAQRLADDIGVSVRTVYRDLHALEEAGFPLYTESVNGRNLWQLMESARNPMPVPFNMHELMALYFGRDALKVLKGTVFYDALKDLLERLEKYEQVRIFLYHEKIRTFHPKLYLFSNLDEKKGILIIGSSNWSRGGFTHNIEANALINLDLSDPEHLESFNEIEEYFKPYWQEIE